jgi:small redox-active disulfide protein 2
MLIKILGPGCANCNALEHATHAALAQLGWPTTVEHVTDYATIAAYGVMSTPALVVDEQVLLAGRVPQTAQIADLLAAHARQQPEGGPR